MNSMHFDHPLRNPETFKKGFFSYKADNHFQIQDRPMPLSVTYRLSRCYKWIPDRVLFVTHLISARSVGYLLTILSSDQSIRSTLTSHEGSDICFEQIGK